GPDALPLEEGELDRPRARGEDHGPGVDLLLAALGLDVHLGRPEEAAATLDRIDAVRLEERRDPPRELLHDLLLPGAELRQIERRHGPRADPVSARARDLLAERGRVDHRLGRDAAPVEADAAERRVLLDDRRLLAE